MYANVSDYKKKKLEHHQHQADKPKIKKV